MFAFGLRLIACTAKAKAIKQWCSPRETLIKPSSSSSSSTRFGTPVEERYRHVWIYAGYELQVNERATGAWTTKRSNDQGAIKDLNDQGARTYLSMLAHTSTRAAVGGFGSRTEGVWGGRGRGGKGAHGVKFILPHACLLGNRSATWHSRHGSWHAAWGTPLTPRTWVARRPRGRQPSYARPDHAPSQPQPPATPPLSSARESPLVTTAALR